MTESASSPPGRLVVRSGEDRDARAIEAVHWAGMEAAYRGRIPGWPGEPRDVESRLRGWRRWLAAPDVDVLVAEVHEVVGFGALRPGADADLDPSTDGELATLYVLPEHWHRGYGQALCEESLRCARRRGFTSVVLWVVDANERARDFYLRYGFTADGATKLGTELVEPYAASRFRISLRGET